MNKNKVRVERKKECLHKMHCIRIDRNPVTNDTEAIMECRKGCGKIFKKIIGLSV